MSQKEIWDGSALTEADKTLTKVKYEGSEIKAKHFICGASPTSIPLIKALTENNKPVGSFILDEGNLVNALVNWMIKFLGFLKTFSKSS